MRRLQTCSDGHLFLMYEMVTPSTMCPVCRDTKGRITHAQEISDLQDKICELEIELDIRNEELAVARDEHDTHIDNGVGAGGEHAGRGSEPSEADKPADRREFRNTRSSKYCDW